MSECNRCTLQRIRKRAKKDGHKVVVRASTGKPAMGGVDVMVHERGVEPNREKHFVAWFMEVPDSCEC